MPVFALIHRLDELSTIFGCHEVADLLVVAGRFFFLVDRPEGKRTAAAMKIDFDLLDAFHLPVVEMVSRSPAFDGFGNGGALLAGRGEVQDKSRNCQNQNRHADKHGFVTRSQGSRRGGGFVFA